MLQEASGLAGKGPGGVQRGNENASKTVQAAGGAGEPERCGAQHAEVAQLWHVALCWEGGCPAKQPWLLP